MGAGQHTHVYGSSQLDVHPTCACCVTWVRPCLALRPPPACVRVHDILNGHFRVEPPNRQIPDMSKMTRVTPVPAHRPSSRAGERDRGGERSHRSSSGPPRARDAAAEPAVRPADLAHRRVRPLASAAAIVNSLSADEPVCWSWTAGTYPED